MHPLVAQRDLELVQRLDPGADSAYLDPLRFKQILYNLLSNAIKFTDAGGSVEVGLSAGPEGRSC